MNESLKEFEKIAPYLEHPLVLVGFVLLVFFGIHKTLIRSGIIPPVNQRTGGKLVQLLLRYGLIIALAVVFLGFALQFFRAYLDSSRVDVNAIISKLEESHKAQIKALEGQFRGQIAQSVCRKRRLEETGPSRR